MTEAVVARSAKLGDSCVREIPRLLTKEEIRDLSRIDSVKFTAAALLEFGLIAAAVWISETWWNPVVYVLAVIVVGSRINGLGALMHDAAHYRGYANRELNDFVGELLALPTSSSMAGYRNTHFAHHRELNSDNDPDWQRNLGLVEYEFPAPPRRMLMYIAQYLSGLKTATAVFGFHKNKETRDIPAAVARARLCFFAGLLLASIAFGFWKLLLLYWIVPLLTVFLAIRYIRSVAEHYAVEHENVLNESRTVLAPFWQLWLIAPWGLNYHLEHHLFPGVPCFRLGELHRLLMMRDPYPRIAHITHGYFSGLLRDCASTPPTETAVLHDPQPRLGQ
jgi:fatty acid desaturase